MAKNAITTISYNEETGEVKNGVSAFIPHREKIKEDFSMVFQCGESQSRLFDDPELTGEAHKIFNYIVFNMDYENKIQFHQAATARRLRIDPSTLCRILKKMVDKGILSVETLGRNVTYTLDNRLAWRGSASNLKRTRKSQQQEAINHATQN